MKIVKCKGCGKIAIIVQDSACPTKCCGEPMEELVANTSDGATEKHVPVVNIEGNRVNVKVGSVDHPMLDEHFIQWIILESSKGIQKKDLNPKTSPAATFLLDDDEKVLSVYEYCNLHGLWKTDL